MKKIYLMLLMAAGLFASCDLETKPHDALMDDDALTVPSNFKQARVNLYSSLKGCINSQSFACAPEIQADMFNAVAGYSNTYGDLYRWDVTSNTGTFSTVYGGAQGAIAIANWIIDSYNKLDLSNENVFDPNPTTNGQTDTDKGLLVVRKAKGEAFFTRAYAIYQLLKYFSPAYTEANANDAQKGASFMTHYDPNCPKDKYPGRKTLAESYKQIYDDLDSADVYINQSGEARCEYISVDAVAALRARVALDKGDWETAWDMSTVLIDGGTYGLATTEGELQSLYWYDGYPVSQQYAGSTEAIFQLVSATSSELPSAQGTRYLPFSEGSVPDFIPTKTFVDLFSEDDYRRSTILKQQNIATTTGTAGTVYVLNKYPDHGYLYLAFNNTESARFAHEPVMFRIAEMYLIAAEAGAHLGKRSAKSYLSDLEDARNAETNADLSTPEGILAEVKNERARELVGEGFRLNDLKRWHMAVKRGTPQQRDLCNLPGANTTDLYRPADSNKIVWAIPKQEADVNKNIKQNPGW